MNTKKVHFLNLDALRTLAFLGVFFYHSFHTTFSYIKSNPIYNIVNSFFKNGDLGVNFFFVLSGFLITYLLVLEEKQTGRINIFNFYMRRVLRIWPLYFFSVIFGFLIFPFFKAILDGTPNETANPILFITFLSNFNNIHNGMPDASILGVLWSVAIEEQFYLVWPLLLIFFKKFRVLTIIFLIAVNIIFRFYYSSNDIVIYFHTLSVLSNLAVGGLFGLIAVEEKALLFFFRKIGILYNVIIYVLIVLLFVFREELIQGKIMIALENLIFSVCFIWIILEQIYSENSLVKFGELNYLNSWGKYTYGLYCLHFIAILIVTNMTKLLGINDAIYVVLVVETFFALILSHLMAWLSYWILERPFLKIKNQRF